MLTHFRPPKFFYESLDTITPAINPLYTSDSLISTFSNIEDSYEMAHNAAEFWAHEIVCIL